ncbi:hypothetical protein F503_08553 [Ophiostoma piceae UAMH 11346]|uniref:J domain-containing protein n=1 Tax=Ophiostoma piceae (strain UAMH 11346) TaxID=1262450 RepID=S3CQ94_OPHP1|nr:hypothetical protein F503_08553 [Ophiostoma piceae UAMH 11346]
MSDSRRRSSRSSSANHRSSGSSSSNTAPASATSTATAEKPATSSSSSSSRRHGSARHSSGGGPSSRSSSSLHRISSGSSQSKSRESLVSNSSSSSHRVYSSSSRASSSASLQPSIPEFESTSNPAPSISSGGGGGDGIYRNAAAANDSRFSLTDQFASTRSVLDFGFDDSASSIFDAQSIFSVGSSGYGGGYSRSGSRAPSIYGGAGVDTSGFGMVGGLDPFPELASSLARVAAGSEALTGSPWQSEEDYLGGSYSTVRDVAEDDDDDDDAATVGGRDDDDDDDDEDDTSTKRGSYTPKTSRSRAPSSAQVTVIEAGSHTDSWATPVTAHMISEDQVTPLPAPGLAPSVSTEHQAQPTQKQQLEQLEPEPPLHPSVDLAFVIPVYRTHYELLGLSREQLTASLPMASVEDRIDFDVRFAFYRLFRLFNSSISNGSSTFTSSPGSFSHSQPITSNLMPESLRPVVRRYFMEIENAYATLIDPVQRLEYNRFLDDLEDEIVAKNGYFYEDDDEEDADETTAITMTTSTAPGGKKDGAGAATGATPKGFPAAVRSAFVRRNDFQTTTDLGARYAVTGGGRADADVDGNTKSLLPSVPDLTSLDYALTQTVRFGLPGMRVYTQNGLLELQKNITVIRNILRERYGFFRKDQTAAKGKEGRRRSLSAAADTVDVWTAPRCGVPVLTLSASAYALSTAPAFAARNGGPEVMPPLGDRYQPLLSEVLGPARIAQLVHARASGCVVVGYRQEFWTQSAMAAAVAAREAAGPTSTAPWPPPPTFIVDVETEVLPRIAMTTRIAHSIPALPASVRKVETRLFGAPSTQPVNVELMVQGAEPVSLWAAASPPLLSTLLSTVTGRAPMPRLGLGVSRRVGACGNLFLCADSGNTWWASSPSTSTLLAPFMPPMVEVGYNIGPHELGMHAGNPLTGPSDRGLKGVDIDMNSLAKPVDPANSAGRANDAAVAPHGTWTISTATTGLGSMATYVRYGRTVFLTPLWRSPPTRMSADAQKRTRQRHTPQRALRVEAELCSADSLLPRVLSLPSSDGYLAVRVLAPFRWWGIRSGWASNTATGFSSTTPANTTPPKLGIEIALSGGGSGLNGGHGAVHVSLYWSRMGQRLKLPFLFVPAGGASSLSAGRLFFWAAVAPVAVMAVRELAQIYWRSAKLRFRAVQKRRKAKRDLAKGIAAAAAANDADRDENEDDSFVFDEVEDRVITRHRAEADELTMILATSVDAQKLLERKMVNAAPGRDAAAASLEDESPRDDELVILSAKYGVALTDDPDEQESGGGSGYGHGRHDSATSGLGSAGPALVGMASRNGWAPDYEVADVTAAVSALVVAADSGMDASVAHVVHPASGDEEQQYVWRGDRLVIPRGLRKNRILGFWDPAPSFERKQRDERARDRDQGRPPRRAKGKKVLHVRYLWKGQERIAEVGERDELRLPSYDDLESVMRR